MLAGLNTRVHSCGYNCAAVEFEPLIRGMGQTVANALRRALLTCVCGWALIGVCVDGANHELDKLDGVKEDLIDIILNLKQLVFGGIANTGIIKGVLSANVKGEVLAHSVNFPNGIRVFNPNQRICYLNSESKLRAELIIAYNAGYLRSEDIRASFGLYLNGYIALDANFSPIKRVSYNITEPEYNATSGDKINMLIESNGAVNLCTVTKNACKLLRNQFASLADSF
ncbi:MAG: hypothetical protein AAI946_00730 [Candidatus Hodgkinia cicadicola]